MGRLSVEGFSYQGALEDFDNSTKLFKKRFATVTPLGTNKAGLDVVATGFFQIGAADRVVEAGSTDSVVNLTAHGANVGDVIRLKTTANTISQREVAIGEIIDANSFQLEGRLDADLTAGDTFDLLGGVTPTYNSDGSVTSGPITFQYDGATQTVIEDTVTPANNRPLPVKLTDVTGDINITAGDLNVQLSHTGASPDSTQIGDGTEILLISAAGEALTQPNGNVASNAADSGNPVKVGAVYNAVSPTFDDGDRADLQVDSSGALRVAEVNLAPGSSPAKNEDDAHASGDTGSYMLSVRQDTIAVSTSADGDYQSMKSNNLGELYVTDTGVEGELTTLNGKVTAFDLDTGGGTENVQGVSLRLSAGGGSIEAQGQNAMAASIPVAIASDQSTLAISAASLPLPTGAATETTLAALAAEDFATQTTLSALNDKVGIHDLDTGGGTENRQGVNLRISASGGSIEAKGQQTSANSIPVVLASDSTFAAVSGVGARQFIRNDYSGTNVTTGAFVELTASLTQDMDQCEIFDSSGQTLEIATGAGGAEVVQFRVFPGGNGLIPIDRAIFATATRVSIRAVSATADAGEININFYSN